MAFHKKFKTSGNTIVINDFKKSKLVFRGNNHLSKNSQENGYTDIPLVGITLHKNIRSDNPEGGEWITIYFENQSS